MRRVARINESGTVVRITIVDLESPLDADQVDVTGQLVNVGDSYDSNSGTFTPRVSSNSLAISQALDLARQVYLGLPLAIRLQYAPVMSEIRDFSDLRDLEAIAAKLGELVPPVGYETQHQELLDIFARVDLGLE